MPIYGTTQYVSTGWTLSGNAPPSGSGTNVNLTLTNDATLTWQWTTNYWLSLTTSGSGAVNVTNQWVAAGTNTNVTATAAARWMFGRWEGTNVQDSLATNVITVKMNQPRAIRVVFQMVPGTVYKFR